MNSTHYIYYTVLLLLLGIALPLHAQTVKGKIYGGGQLAQVEGDTNVNIYSGTVGDGTAFDGGVFGGGLGEPTIVTGDVTVLIGKTDAALNSVGPTINGDVYGGSALGNTNCTMAAASAIHTATDGKTTAVTLNAGIINGSMYGGALGQKTGVDGAASDIAANVYGPVLVTVNGGNVFTTDGTGANGSGGVFGCNNLNGEPKSTVMVDVYGTNSHDFNSTPADFDDDKYAVFSVYGGGNQANYTVGTPVVTVHNCDNSIQYVYGGGNAAHLTNGNTKVTVYGGNRIGTVFGGGNGQVQAANISGGTDVKIYGGSIGSVFGGSNSRGTIGGQLSVEIDSKKEDGKDYACPSNIDNVYGGGNQADYSVFGYNDDGSVKTSGTPIADPILNIKGGYVVENVFGGGLQAQMIGNTHVNVTGGTVQHDVYGGGALANVDGNTEVNLKGGTVGGAYGGGLGAKNGVNGATEDVAALVYGDATVTLDGSIVNGDGIFGGNNLNGTPKGHVKVHVKQTKPRDGQASPSNQTGEGTNSYDVPAVYGGGNLSAYQPNNTKEFAEVLIENCDNSIEYVYGGGNAAPVPATKVVIKGANAINHAFAGGNGAGVGNPGADVGYLGYFSSGSATEYGSGLASITVFGGTVHNVYGGSNTLGYIRGGTSISVENEDGACPLNVGNVFGGGNEADIECNVLMNLDCNEGSAILYAGANNADVHGDITLNIHSGTYGKVFCGNNMGGAVKGKLTVNVDETGCWPIMIGQLYGGGNMAGYSVFGYEVESDGKTKRDDENHVVLNTEGEQLYDDPVVNLISFTRIGKVFGGGYGETAVVYGNTNLNVEPIKGIFADGSVKPSFILNEFDEREPNSGKTTLEVLGADKIGSIGSIYGGGNAGAVYGNTEVKIGTLAKNHHISGSDTTSEEEVVVTITGNVFGGGNEAIVSGNTNVTIGQ